MNHSKDKTKWKEALGLQNSIGKKQTDKITQLQTSATFHEKRRDDSEGGTIAQRMNQEPWRLIPTSWKWMKELSIFPPVGFQNCYGQWLLCLFHFPLFWEEVSISIALCLHDHCFLDVCEGGKDLFLSQIYRLRETVLKEAVFQEVNSRTLFHPETLFRWDYGFLTLILCPVSFSLLYSHLLKHLSAYCLLVTELHAGYSKLNKTELLILSLVGKT